MCAGSTAGCYGRGSNALRSLGGEQGPSPPAHMPKPVLLPHTHMLSHMRAGTAMHHAAMANKKEMMFALARLGCDWRARAEGIDGASASFVLCGQHGKTTRQQVRRRLPVVGLR